jgi:hypothetical protein
MNQHLRMMKLTETREIMPTFIQTTNAELRLSEVDDVAAEPAVFFVIGRPGRLLLMRSTGAALRLAPTPPGFPLRMTSPGRKGTVDLELRP